MACPSSPPSSAGPPYPPHLTRPAPNLPLTRPARPALLQVLRQVNNQTAIKWFEVQVPSSQQLPKAMLGDLGEESVGTWGTWVGCLPVRLPPCMLGSPPQWTAAWLPSPLLILCCPAHYYFAVSVDY